MPNWCENVVNMVFARNVWESEVVAINDAVKMRSLLQYIKPRPSDKDDDWYNWNIQNWGTKWDVEAEILYVHEDEEEPDTVSVSLRFSSAWSPPIAAFVDWDKAISVSLEYFESGIMFGGVTEFRHGSRVSESYADTLHNIAKLSDWHNDCVESILEQDELLEDLSE